ncbi:MAG: M56 family metallopeptidase [Bacteroidota bacterium]
MIKFLIYLFESGMCLTLLFLVYYFFLRKETYFTFNRIYLLGILVFSLLFPVIHLSFTLPESEVLESRVEEISKFRNYYENLIALTDPDYANSFTKPFQENTSDEFEDEFGTESLSRSSDLSTTITDLNTEKNKTGFWASVNWSSLLLILYLLGILFFTVRLILLFRWINQTINKYGLTFENGVKMVKMDEEVPPFSFFRFVFLNRETISHSGFGQVLAHEKVHISQRHSFDLMLAHAITVFQWFNPFVWFINNAMKTNHEYIADRIVVEQGNELFDYQSLLLKQIISIRSVELVNNFNLLNIKKRIAMMTKIKSGLAAQLKALVVIPAAILLFFFFAEITFAQENIGIETKDVTKEIQGFWKNKDDNSYGMLLNFKGNDLQILESVENYRVVQYKSGKGTIGTTLENFNNSKIFEYVKSTDDLCALITLPLEPDKAKLILLTLKNDELIVGWTPDQVSIYERIKVNNSLQSYSKQITEEFKPVSTSYYRISENPDKTYFLLMNKKGEMLLENERVDFQNLQEKIKQIKQQGSPFAASEKVPIIVVDARCEMAYVDVMYRKLREIDELRYILSVKPFDEKVPEIFYHNVGIPRLLPPQNAKLLDEEEVEKSGMKIHRIDLTKGGITPESVKNQLQKGIVENQKYVILYIYDKETSYKEYITYLDEVYQVIFAKRNQLAQKKYNLDYDDLAKAQQKEIRKVYPLTLTEKSAD